MADDEIFKQFREHSVAEFFKKNRQMLGFSGKVRSLTMIVHEFVTNSVTWDTPTVVRIDGAITMCRIGELIDGLMEENEAEYDVDAELESLRNFKKFEVLCFDKNELKLKFKEVKSVHRHKMKNDERIIRIRLVGGRRADITSHHSVFTLKDGEIIPLAGKDVRVGDYLCVPRKEWAGFGKKHEINILEESLKLPDGNLGEFSVFGVKSIVYTNRHIMNKIKEPLSAHQRNHDFYANYMKCDRLPLRLLRVLSEEDRKAFYNCKLGYARAQGKKIACTMPVSPGLMQLLGLYVAEGNTRKNLTSSSLSFGSHEKELIGVARRLIREVFGIDARVEPAHKTAVNVTIGSKTAAFLIANLFKCGKTAKEKAIPDIVFNTEAELALEFLYGYLAGDGYPSQAFTSYLENGGLELDKKITMATASGKLATGMEYLLSSLGHTYSRHTNDAEERMINGIMAQFSEAHVIEFYPLQRQSPLNFYPMEIGGVQHINDSQLTWSRRERGQKTITYQKLASTQVTINESAARFMAGDLGVLPVVSVEEYKCSMGDYVYDYSVDGDENFVGGYGAICLHNSLDACEEAGILPDIFVQVDELDAQIKDYYRVTVKDNGPGIPRTHLAKALGQMLAGTKFHRYLQQRGQQGIGASACVMFSYLTTGQPVKATSAYRGKRLSASITIDFKSNKPVMEDAVEEPAAEGESGLTVIAEFKDVRYERSNYGVYEYLRRTALANPHCSITLVEPGDQKSVFPRSVQVNPRRPFEIKPHPLGIGTHDLLEFAKHNKDNRKLSAFLQNTFSRFSAARVDELRTLVPGVDFDKNPAELDWNEAELLVNAFKTVKWIAPATDSLVPIDKEQIEISFTNIFRPEVLVVTERSPKVYRGGIPFMVEVGLAYGGGLVSAEKKGEVMRFANRVPLLFDSGGCGITETIKSMDWKHYDIKDFENEPIAVLVNLVSVYVPYTSAGKQAISNEEDIMEEIKFALMEASRGVQKFLSGRRRANEMAGKKKLVSRYVQQLSSDLAILSGDKKDPIQAKLTRIIEEKYAQEDAAEEEKGDDKGGAEPAEKAEEGEEE